MRVKLAVVMLLSLLAAPKQSTAAQPVSAATQTVELLPGGRTIGGPGAGVLIQGTEILLMEVRGDGDMCVTVVNTAPQGEVAITLRSGGFFNSFAAFTGETKTFCNAVSGISTFAAQCVNAPTCSFLWRVDER